MLAFISTGAQPSSLRKLVDRLPSRRPTAGTADGGRKLVSRQRPGFWFGSRRLLRTVGVAAVALVFLPAILLAWIAMALDRQLRATDQGAEVDVNLDQPSAPPSLSRGSQAWLADMQYCDRF